MRLRVGVVLCLFATFLGVGCREALAPNIDNNRPPETWITAAPFDTITVRDEGGGVELPPDVNRIPVRFHVYWAGSDRDGAVAGFYWAVVETLPIPPDPDSPVPPLPGPKPSDYRFTTKTDSTFIFTVAEEVNDRQHAFFIYAVDNLGKPDPTPARFIFVAQDDYPPLPWIVEARAIGTIYDALPGGGLAARQDTVEITDVDLGSRNKAPRDTVPSNSTLFFRWIGVPQIAGSVVTKYKYKLDEPEFVEVPASVTSATYNSGIGNDTRRVKPGIKVFTVRAFDQAGGKQDSTRRFQLNFAPDSWFAGPDRSSPTLRTDPRSNERLFAPSDELPVGGIASSLLGPDSVRIFPAQRTERRTFFEIWNDTIWVRSEGDTVHLNSWVVFHGGGFDKDSDYNVRVSALARTIPGFPAGPVLDPAPVNGSPVGFRTQISTALWPSNFPSPGPPSNLFPLFDPNDVLDSDASRRIGYYQPMIQSGTAYCTIQAEDGDRDKDKRISDGLALARRVDGDGGGPPLQGEVELRSKVIKFAVDKPPHFKTDLPSFQPKPDGTEVYSGDIWQFNLPGADLDPFKVGITPAGGPDPQVTLRRKVTFRFVNPAGDSVTVKSGYFFDVQSFNINIRDPVLFPPPIKQIRPGPVLLDLELCDCVDCENFAGQGRCIYRTVGVTYAPPGSGLSTPPALSPTRPGTE